MKESSLKMSKLELKMSKKERFKKQKNKLNKRRQRELLKLPKMKKKLLDKLLLPKKERLLPWLLKPLLKKLSLKPKKKQD